MAEAHTIQVRPATLADLDTVVEFNAAMAAETEGKTLDREVLRNGVRLALDDPARSLYFIAHAGDRAVGQTMVTFEWSDWRNGFFWWIQSVYVDPSFRGRGVFRALYAHIRDQARARPDVCGIRLYVHDANRRAMHTYEKLGTTHTRYRVYEEDWLPGHSA